MFGPFAVVFFLFAFVAGGAGAHTSGWFTPQQSMYAGLACLAAHLCGFMTNRRS